MYRYCIDKCIDNRIDCVYTSDRAKRYKQALSMYSIHYKGLRKCN